MRLGRVDGPTLFLIVLVVFGIGGPVVAACLEARTLSAHDCKQACKPYVVEEFVSGDAAKCVCSKERREN